MRIVAILAARDEERFIAGCLEHFFAHGCEAYLIDDGSEDRTVAIAERFLGKGLIGIETRPRSDTFHWSSILDRKAEIAASLDADWFLHADPDEIRLPPRRGVTLADAFAEVDSLGYNAVNFQEFTFVPTREAPDHDHPAFRRTMRRYYPFAPCFPHQVKAWKNLEKRVDLASMGGHRVSFPGLRLFPESFPMRHYLFLSIPHALEKYGRRRYDPREVATGWHGWRARVEEWTLRLPADSELRLDVGDESLDESNPRVRHVLDDDPAPAETEGSR